MNATAMLFDAGEMAVRPCREAARPKVEVVEWLREAASQAE